MNEIDEMIADGRSLELFVASFYQAHDYFVDSNLQWIEDSINKKGKSNILEIDVLSKKYSEKSIESVLVECKRGCTFVDLFKFVGISSHIKADINILVCVSHEIDQIKKLGEGHNIIVKTPEELILDIDTDIDLKIILFYDANHLSNQIFDKQTLEAKLAPQRGFSIQEKEAYGLIRSYLSELIGRVWRETDIIKQIPMIKNLLDSHKDYVRIIARKLGITPRNKSSEYYMAINVLCQSAGLLILKVRVSYIISAVQCAILVNNDPEFDIEQVNDTSFTDAVKLMRNNINTAVKIPIFIQSLIFIFGGVFAINDNDEDLHGISEFINMDVLEVKETIELIKELFTLPNIRLQWGFIDDMGVMSLKYIPSLFKGLGMLNRTSLKMSTEIFCDTDQWIEEFHNFTNRR
jgi:hypothetical protein